MITGLGALAFGSGAVTVSGAFSGNTTNPSAELNVLADARLRVKAPGSMPDDSGLSFGTDGGTDAVKTSTLDGFSDSPFNRSSLPNAQIHDTDENDNYVIKAGVTTKTNGHFNGIMEIVNDDGSSHDVGINYGDPDDSSTHGYGNDVDTSNYDSSDNTMGRQDVQEMYQFYVPDDTNYLPSNMSTGSGPYRLSPDPTTDNTNRFDQTITIGAGNSAILILDYDTSGKTGLINSTATGGNPFEGSTYVDLLESLWVEADPNYTA